MFRAINSGSNGSRSGVMRREAEPPVIRLPNASAARGMLFVFCARECDEADRNEQPEKRR
jgi:hypothetical protein